VFLAKTGKKLGGEEGAGALEPEPVAS
jgi:hypothetical protein